MTAEDIIIVAIGLTGAIGIPALCLYLTNKMRETGRSNCQTWVSERGGMIVHIDCDFNHWRELKGVVRWVDASGAAHTMSYTGKTFWSPERFEDKTVGTAQNQASEVTARKLAEPQR
jgi:hypothetical protein